MSVFYRFLWLHFQISHQFTFLSEQNSVLLTSKLGLQLPTKEVKAASVSSITQELLCRINFPVINLVPELVDQTSCFVP
jgi:hypothetical protein